MANTDLSRSIVRSNEDEKRVLATLKILQDKGFIGHKDFAEGKLALSERGAIDKYSRHSWARIAFEASKILDIGQWWPSESGVTFVNGSHCFWVKDYQEYNGIRSARSIVRRVTGNQDPPYSVTSCGRKLIKWTGVKQGSFNNDTSALIWSLAGEEEKRLWHFRHCVPTVIPEDIVRIQPAQTVTLWDVSAFYYTILRKLLSPMVSLCGETVIFHPLPRDKRLKWDCMIDVITGDKGLRNSMIGGMYAGGGSVSYSNGLEKLWDKREGPIAGAAALIVHTGYWLCWRVVQATGALLACTDSAATFDPLHAPQVWTDLGFNVRIKQDKAGNLAQGDCDIRAVSNYRIGQVCTEDYKQEEARKLDVSNGKKRGSLSRIIRETSLAPTKIYGHWIERVK